MTPPSLPPAVMPIAPIELGLDSSQLRDLESMDFGEDAEDEFSWGDATPTPMFSDEPTPTPVWRGRGRNVQDTEEAPVPSMNPSHLPHQTDTAQDTPTMGQEERVGIISRLFGRKRS